ncbi:cytoplasmic iron level regulating protein YaaA (DUF328/UPF0246 family) [Bradyrhizobium sp. AZCC 1610]|uniref:DUF6884 domain-containing protein n=1 Tax=Bradyrhizobium sp. AZCC 1610 TaxID=3117020 RepID=UPI002FEFEFA7
MKADVAFVSCVKTKSTTAELAEHLYISPWFRMAKEYVRQNADRWFILSAEYGLLRPGQMIDPYEATLNNLGIKLRQHWAKRVMHQMAELDLWGSRAIVLAGKNYREFLMDPLMLRFKSVEVPMDGLMMGQQLSWLSKRVN